MDREDPRRTLGRLYRGVDGFEISRADERRVQRSRGSPTYGELMPTASLRLFEALELGRRDVLYDLGAGVGKLVLLAALATPVRRAVGIELSQARVGRGQRVLAQARRERLRGAGRAELRRGDMLREVLDEATVIYTCSTAFSSPFMQRLAARVATLPKLRAFVSLRDLDPDPAFELREVPRLDASWKRRTKVHIYAPR